MEQGFRIELSSKYAEWWRYNVAMMCGCFDQADNRTGFAAQQNHTAEAQANLAQKPEELTAGGLTMLDTPPCHHILLYIYIVPHTLPASNDIALTQPFEVDIRATYAGQKVLTEQRTINQWSGASIELRISRE